MSHSNDSEEVTLQNGDLASHDVEEKEDSNGHISPEISINQVANVIIWVLNVESSLFEYMMLCWLCYVYVYRLG